eukprot:SAG31_NODE_1988_length_6721_cov_11.339928_4_plen_175_part_00
MSSPRLCKRGLSERVFSAERACVLAVHSYHGAQYDRAQHWRYSWQASRHPTQYLPAQPARRRLGHQRSPAPIHGKCRSVRRVERCSRQLSGHSQFQIVQTQPTSHVPARLAFTKIAASVWDMLDSSELGHLAGRLTDLHKREAVVMMHWQICDNDGFCSFVLVVRHLQPPNQRP